MWRLREKILVLAPAAFLLGAAAASGRSSPMAREAAYLALASFTLVLLLPAAVRRSWPALLLPPLLFLLLLRVGGTHPPASGGLLPLLYESCVVAAAVVLGRQIADNVHELQQAVSQIVLPASGAAPHSQEQVQEHFYREIRRARLARQPLTVVAVGLAEDSREACDRLTEEAVRTLSHEFAFARVADLMRRESEYCDLVARIDGHLVTALPAVAAHDAARITAQLQAAAAQNLGLRLACGTATFPEEELTLVGLLQHAESAMRRRLRELRAAEAAHDPSSEASPSPAPSRFGET